MDIVEQIKTNLLDPETHGPILKALVEILLEEQDEKAVREQIKRWIQEIEAEIPPSDERED